MSSDFEVDLFTSTCSEHGKACCMKTGVKEGPNRGKSYLICSNSSMPCDHHVLISKQSPMACVKHQHTVELVSPAVKDGVKRVYMRCIEGKRNSKWCYYIVTTRTSDADGKCPTAKPPSNSNERALKDVNSLPSEVKVREKAKVQVTPKEVPKPSDSLKVYGKARPDVVVKTEAKSTNGSTCVQPEVRPKVKDVRQEPNVLSNASTAVVNPYLELVHNSRDPQAAKQHIASEIGKKKAMLRMADKLPDRGQKIKDHITQLEKTLEQIHITESNQPETKTSVVSAQPSKTVATAQVNGGVKLTDVTRLPPHVLREMYASRAPDQRLFGGRMTDERMERVNSKTTEALEALDKQLKDCPQAEQELSDPKHLLIDLMTHQRQALTWLQWREQQKPAGGVLADDMGLGKTLTMISLVMLDKQSRTSSADTPVHQPQWLNKSESIVISEGTLIVCMASLVHQWAKEIEARCKKGSLSVLIYHGPSREKSIIKLSAADVVITTYNIVQKEVKLPELLKKDKSEQDKPAAEDEVVEGDGALARIAWKRLVLDEAHQIKNFRSTTALSVCRLRAIHRWALTGTPIQNDLLDFYSLLRFLRCSPFDEYKLWKRWVDNKLVSGDTMLSVLVNSLLLRRTKEQKTSTGKALVPLPSKDTVTHELELGVYERKLYDQLFAKCKSAFGQYVSSKTDDSIGAASQSMWKGERIKGDTILLMLLRLRQCCSHPSLTKEALVEEELKGEGVELDLVSSMMELGLQDFNPDKSDAALVDSCQPVDSSPESCKIKALLREIVKIRSKNSATKFVVVSQWTSMLELVGQAIAASGLTHCTIRGDVPAKKRADMVHEFNTNPASPPVMLVSLRAGGVGLNLIGASNLFILDLHWNPALEQQACDRIYRLGQKNEVVIHKFVCRDTIETRILQLQKTKLKLASDALTGSKTVSSKLTLNDLKQLFNTGGAERYKNNNFQNFGPRRFY